MKKLLAVAIVSCVLLGSPRAHAQFGPLPVIDAASLAETIEEYAQIIIQWNELLNTSHSALQAFRDAYSGLKDWKHMGWADTLQILNMPWFDDVDGIEGVRNVATLSVMTAGQIDQLWQNLDPDSWKSNPRYKNDPWYRNKVNSLYRQSKRARATRAKLLQHMQKQNAALTADLEKIKTLRAGIEKENKDAADAKRPVNQGLITSLQSEITATEAKYQGESLQVANQRAIMFMVGADDAQRVYLETRDRGWINSNNRGIRDMGHAITR